VPNVCTHYPLQATIDFFCRHQDNVEFVWHGGEPLLAGKDFYRRAAKIQTKWKKSGKRIANFLQTNGTLVDKDWADLFVEIGFGIGVSFDAPTETHDSLRIGPSGSQNSEKVLQSINLLKDRNIFNGASCCISKLNVTRPREILNFFLNAGIKSIKFLRIKGGDSKSPCNWQKEAVSSEEYADFILEIFKMWIEIDDPELEIRDIKSVVDIILGGSFRECTYMGKCNQFVTVFNDGSIFPCDCLSNNPSSKFGHVFESYEKVIKNPNLLRFTQAQLNAKSLCGNCKWLFLCQGGCTNDVDNRKETCTANRRMFEEMDKILISYDLK
jgi:uncharacterized protein